MTALVERPRPGGGEPRRRPRPGPGTVRVTVDGSAEPGRHRRESTASGLFGRGMIYVVVWSLQLVVASVVSPILAHLLVPAQFGYLSTSIALYQVFSVVMVFGLDQALVIEHGEGGTRRISAPRVIWLAAGVAATLSAALLATGPWWAPAAGFPGFHGIVVLALLWAGPGAVNMVIMALLRSRDRLGGFVAVNLLTSIGGQAGGILVLSGGSHSAVAYGWAGVVAQYAALLIGLLLARPSLRGLADREWATRVGRTGVAMTASALALFLLNSGDRVLLQRIDGAGAVARYQVAYIVGSVPILLLSFLNQAWLPRILEIGDRVRQWRVLAVSRDLLLRVVAPAVASLVIVAPVALKIVAPASYDDRSLLPVVFWVAIAALPVTDCAATTRALVARRRTGAVALATAVAAVLNIGLNLVLIPSWHVTGAAVATLVAFAAQAAVARLILGRDAALARPGGRSLLVVLGGVLLAAAGAVATPTTLVWLAGRLVVAVVLAALALLALRRASSVEL